MAASPQSSIDPWQIGHDYERLATADERRQRGAWFTPRRLVEYLAAEAIAADWLPRFVLDPTCGGGGFLLGVLDRLVAVGVDPADAIGRVGGVDLDPGAVVAARAALDAWSTAKGVDNTSLLAVADGLDGLPPRWPRPELIIGNPPFATPLRGQGFDSKASSFRTDHADQLGPYADLAAIHLLANIIPRQHGDRVAFVLPQSLLSSRDTAGLRAWLEAQTTLRSFWATRATIFEASVQVFTAVFSFGDEDAAPSVRLASGSEPVSLTTTQPAAMAALAAEALGAPKIDLDQQRALGPVVAATAGFRDEYYGLAAACVEEPPGAIDSLRLVTVGALDPLVCHWGSAPLTFAKQKWERPVVDASRLEGRVARWVAEQCRPKILLPTQSKVFEPVIDRAGTLVPVTPVLSVHTDELDLVAALLLAPPVVAWAYRQWFGAAMSADALKIAAKDLPSLPIPADRVAWERAAALLATHDASRSAVAGGAGVVAGGASVVAGGAGVVAGGASANALVVEVGRVMNGAFGASPEVFDWWEHRLPRRG